MSALTFATGFRRVRVQRFGLRQCRQDFGGLAGQARCDEQLEAGEEAAQNSGKTEFCFRIGPRHKRFGGWALSRSSGRKEAVQLHRKAGNYRTVQRAAGPVQRVRDKLLALRLVVDFDLFLRCQHQPAFLHPGDGVGAEFRAVLVVAAHTDFNDEFGGRRVSLAVIFTPSPHYYQVWFRFRIPDGQWLLAAHVTAGGHGPAQDVFQEF